MSNFAEPTEPH